LFNSFNVFPLLPITLALFNESGLGVIIASFFLVKSFISERIVFCGFRSVLGWISSAAAPYLSPLFILIIVFRHKNKNNYNEFIIVIYS
jgi:hypothetical protein